MKRFKYGVVIEFEGKKYTLVKNGDSSCIGCAFNMREPRCSQIGDVVDSIFGKNKRCSYKDFIYVELKEIKPTQFTTRKIKANYTPEMAKDLEVCHSSSLISNEPTIETKPSYPNRSLLKIDIFKDFDKFVGTRQQIYDEEMRLMAILNDAYNKQREIYNDYEQRNKIKTFENIKKDYGTANKEFNDIIMEATLKCSEDDSYESIAERFEIIADAVKDILKLTGD